MKLILSIFILFVGSISSAQNYNSCVEVLDSNSVSLEYSALADERRERNLIEPYRTELGDTYWGFYKCNSCKGRTSARPNVHDDQACDNCGYAHSGETYIPPAMFEKDGALWLVDPGRLVSDLGEQEIADSGKTGFCPFCNSSSFSIDEQCVSCGARALEPDTIRSDLDEYASAEAQTVSPVGSSAATIVGEEPPVVNQTPVSSTSRRALGRALGLTAGVALVVTSAYGVHWGNQTYSVEGVVTDFNQSEVTVSYEDKSGYDESIVLGRPGNETQIWRVGETMELYFINWSSTPRGAERLDGNVLTPAE